MTPNSVLENSSNNAFTKNTSTHTMPLEPLTPSEQKLVDVLAGLMVDRFFEDVEKGKS